MSLCGFNLVKSSSDKCAKGGEYQSIGNLKKKASNTGGGCLNVTKALAELGVVCSDVLEVQSCTCRWDSAAAACSMEPDYPGWVSGISKVARVAQLLIARSWVLVHFLLWQSGVSFITSHLFMFGCRYSMCLVVGCLRYWAALCTLPAFLLWHTGNSSFCVQVKFTAKIFA